MKAIVKVETREGQATVDVAMKINWACHQPTFSFEYKGLTFDKRYDDVFYSNSHKFQLKIADLSDFNRVKELLIAEINQNQNKERNQSFSHES